MKTEIVELIAFQMLTSDIKRGRVIDVDDPELWADASIVEVARALGVYAVDDGAITRIRREYDARRHEVLDDDDFYDAEDDDDDDEA